MSATPRPVAWGCPVCRKFDWNDNLESLAKPEHIPYRGIDIGNCSGGMIPLYNYRSHYAALELADAVLADLPSVFTRTSGSKVIRKLIEKASKFKALAGEKP